MSAQFSKTGFVQLERLLDCVHCGLCLTACPTYLDNGLEADSPRGRIYLIRGLQEGRIQAGHETVRHLDLCLACRACETACPSGVEYGAVIESVRPAIESIYCRRWPSRLRRTLAARLVAHPRGQRWLVRYARIAPRRLLRRIARLDLLPEALRYGAALGAVLPRPAKVPLPPVIEPHGTRRGTMILFTGCLAQTFFGETNRHVARLLAHAGYRVHVPSEPLCCGALLLHLGHRAAAVAVARHAAARLRHLPGDSIVATAAGCGAMLRNIHELVGDPEVAAQIGARTRDATVVLAEAQLPSPPGRIDQRVTYHDACHLAHAQGVRSAPRRLLGSIPGIELVELPEADRCCGSAGTYNLTEPRSARRLVIRKVADIVSTGAAIVATANPGCLLQIRAGLTYHGTALRVAHPVDLLAEVHFGPGGNQGEPLPSFFPSFSPSGLARRGGEWY